MEGREGDTQRQREGIGVVGCLGHGVSTTEWQHQLTPANTNTNLVLSC